MRKIKTVMLVTLLALALILQTIPLIPTASAAAAYTEINGTLSGGNYTLRIPSPIDNWNRVLVIFCRGYSRAKPASPMSPTADMLANDTISEGLAFATTDYGAGGSCIKKAMNATYELTQYIVSTYKVAKVFLLGASMGGAIALLLGEKYPTVYSGVLDMFGMKNQTFAYDAGPSIVAMNDTELTKHLQGLNAPIPPYPFSQYSQNISTVLQLYRDFISQACTDMVTETGGTPTQVPDAYREIDPLYHANISIPVITVHGTSDALVPYEWSLQYQAAVAAAGKSAWYRLYSVVGGQHGDPSMFPERRRHLTELVSWSEQLRPSLRASAFSNVTILRGWTWWFFAQSIGGKGPYTFQWYEGTTALQGQTSMVLPITKKCCRNLHFLLSSHRLRRHNNKHKHNQPNRYELTEVEKCLNHSPFFFPFQIRQRTECSLGERKLESQATVQYAQGFRVHPVRRQNLRLLSQERTAQRTRNLQRIGNDQTTSLSMPRKPAKQRHRDRYDRTPDHFPRLTIRKSPRHVRKLKNR